MKWVLLGLAIASIWPVGRFARSRPKVRVVLVTILGALPFIGIDQLNIALAENLEYRGDTTGLEIHLIDVVAAMLLFSLPKREFPAPYRLPRWVYFGLVLLSVFVAAVPEYSWWSLERLLRGYLVLIVASRACEDGKLAKWMVNGFVIGVAYSFYKAIEQRYLGGQFQVTGGFEHPNSLGMAMNLVFPIAAAVLLAGQGGYLALATVGMAGICVIFSLSRGSLAMFGLAMVAVLLGSLVRRVTQRKLFVTAGLAFVGALLLAKSADSIIERLETAPKASLEARDRFEGAAKAMLEDHALGIGINNYSYVLAHAGYADRFEMPEVDRDGLAHHIYWLTAAELGYLGLLAYLWLILSPLWTALKGAWRARDDIRGDVMLGAAAGMLAMHVHGTAEWIARQAPMMYLFFMVAGMVYAFEKRTEQQREAAIRSAAGEN